MIKLHGYTIPVLLARGADSEVYRVYKPSTETYYAVKAIKNVTSKKFNNVKREIECLNTLNSVSFPRVIDVIRRFSTTYIVMNWIRGMPLDSFQWHLIPLATRKFVALSLFSLIDSLHFRGIIHRDIKLSNFIAGLDQHIYCVDFGYAQMGEKKSSIPIQGTPENMAPELFSIDSSRIDWFKSDIFALGKMIEHILFEQTFKDSIITPLTHVAPENRPSSCKNFAELIQLSDKELDFQSKYWNEHIRLKIEMDFSRQLHSSAKEYLILKKFDYAYELVTEAIDYWPQNHEALELLNNLMSRRQKPSRKKLLSLGVLLAACIVLSAELFSGKYFKRLENLPSSVIYNISRLKRISVIRTNDDTVVNIDRIPLKSVHSETKLTVILTVKCGKSVVEKIIINGQNFTHPIKYPFHMELKTGTYEIYYLQPGKSELDMLRISLLPFQHYTIQIPLPDPDTVLLQKR